MNTVNNAKELFDKCRHIEGRIDAMLDETSMMRAMATKVTASYSDQPRGGSSDKSPIERAVIRLIELERELEDEVNNWIDHRRLAQLIIERLEDDRYRDVLSWRYFSRWNWDRIADAFGMDDRTQVWRIHGRALLEVNRVLEQMPSSQI